MKEDSRFMFGDCRELMKEIQPETVDLVLTDPPYGIRGNKFSNQYNRTSLYVMDGYVEVSEDEYGEFSRQWIRELERILRPGGSVYVFSGWNNLRHILNAFAEDTNLVYRNHLIWKYNFGVWATKKYIVSHYHLLYYVKKPVSDITFNAECRFSLKGRVKDDSDYGSHNPNYEDREDVWTIRREFKQKKLKNINTLPSALVRKILSYSSNRDDVVLDPFAGGFTVCLESLSMGRKTIGIEINDNCKTFIEGIL